MASLGRLFPERMLRSGLSTLSIIAAERGQHISTLAPVDNAANEHFDVNPYKRLFRVHSD